MTLSRRYLTLAAGAASAATLLGAFYVQYVLGFLPCHLCLLQRWPHAVLIVLAALAFAVPGRLLPLAAAATALVGAGIALYHSGVERKFWAGPTDCTGGQNLSGLSGADLLDFSTPSPIIRCDEVGLQVLGLSLANINLILCLGLVWLWIAIARRG
ncbi:disulfide bond formation protein B [Tropicimonas sp. IMCC34043]|uniref:disulfide bond formation protein B n=1 Tax=Tropicimonas sp. IMCC34043 TaxID=2248760 RepID=UPI001E36F26F|nr:disulfide bond formation protein B [Tropicimonas sp. IMCC34043]